MCSSLCTEDLQTVQTTLSPILSRHSSQCMTLPGLFEKVDAVYQQRHDLHLNGEQLRLVERVHLDFQRAGATLSNDAKQEFADLKAELASLTTEFQQNVMKDEETYEMVLQKDDLAGCPDGLVEAAKQAAVERHKENDYVITLGGSLVEPFLTYSSRRDLRKQAFEAWTQRGEMDPGRNNLVIATKILRLRKRMAELHGYPSFAHYQCVDRMAKTPDAVSKLLTNVWELAKKSAQKELEDLEDFVKSSGETLEGGVQPWDWRYYAEKVRQEKFDFDESLLKPYLSLEKVTEALFAVSKNLYGLKYIERTDVQSYHEDVKTYEVREELPDGTDKLTAVFIHDNFARKHKNSGAWMSEYRTQSRNFVSSEDEKDGYLEGIPIISNNNNFAKGENTLLSYDDATTCFHECGHGHHGMLSDATYSRLASTNVVTDFVELPSQLMEHWFDQREVLKKYARHYETGEPVPDELLDKLMKARMFNEGFATIEYTACALLDMALHQLEEYPDDFDLAAFEKAELEKLGMPQGIVMRHRPAHFQHLFSTNMYAAGYYVYLWAEVLDADVFAAFQEAGDIFDKETAAKARKHIYSAGNTVAPDELFRRFRGRDPDIKYMLAKKGLVPSGS